MNEDGLVWWQTAVAKAKQYGALLQTKRVRQLATAVFLLLSVVVIAALVHANWDAFINHQWQIQPLWLLPTFLFATASLFLSSFAWHLLVSQLAGYNNPRHNIKTWHYANLAKRIPGSVWYVASRAVMNEAKGISKISTSLISGLEFLLSLLSAVTLFVLSIPFWVLPADIRSQIDQYWYAIFLLPLSLLIVHPTLLGKLWRKIDKSSLIRPLQWRHTIAWFSLDLLIWLLSSLLLFSSINVLYPLPISQLPAIMGIWTLSGAISLAGAISLSPVGLREVSLAILLAQLMPPPIAILMAILFRIIWLIAELIGSLLSLLL